MRNSVIFISGSLLLLSVVIGCRERDDDTAPVIQVPTTVEATPVSFANKKCPIMGGTPSVDLTAQYEGKTIGFCCDGCPQKWAALSDEAKAEKFAPVAVETDEQDSQQNASGK
ncbi:MAG: hypothetical protein HKN47_07330 [Pirellulaceae bacterium]|nr:hypothetical protein [Pirellulaceae bacterium]